MAELSHLTADEQLTYWIGAAARNDEHVSARIRMMIDELNRMLPHDHRATAGNNYSRRQELAKVLLGKLPTLAFIAIPDDAVELGRRILGDSKVVHERRNWLVHSIWASAENEASYEFVVAHMLMGNWERPEAPETLDALKALAPLQIRDLTRLGFFTQSLTMRSVIAANIHAGIEDGDESCVLLLRAYEAMARGEFDIEADGRLRPRDPAHFA